MLPNAAKSRSSSVEEFGLLRRPAAETETERGLIRPRQTAVLLECVFLGRGIDAVLMLPCSFQSALHRRRVGGGDRGCELT
jgi:hypothetical protein